MREKPQVRQSRLHADLSKREREIMDILLREGEVSAEGVRARLSDPPGNSAVRSTLTKLERQGLVAHREEGLKFLYSVAVPSSEVRRSALSRLVEVFFQGSAAEAMAGLLDQEGTNLSEAELDRLEAAIRAAKERAG